MGLAPSQRAKECCLQHKMDRLGKKNKKKVVFNGKTTSKRFQKGQVLGGEHDFGRKLVFKNNYPTGTTNMTDGETQLKPNSSTRGRRKAEKGMDRELNS